MSVQDFIFRIGADVDDFNKSITEVEAELKRWKETIKTATGSALVQANQNVNALTDSIANLKKVGLDKLPQATANGALALNSLGQVARDLPFGFIAIQNNLPIVIDQFQSLVTTSKGVGGALKSIGAALIGPAGFAFATGLIISGITTLVQQYGSLGGAIDAIFGKQQSLTDLQNKYTRELNKSNESQLAEIANLRSLTNILTSNNSTSNERNGAYQTLNQQYPGLLANLSEEEVLSGRLNTTIAQRLQLLTTQIQLEGRREALTKLIAKASQEQLEFEQDLSKAEGFTAVKLAIQGFLQGGGINGVVAGATAIGNTFSRTTQETAFFSQELDNVNKELSNVTAQINAFVKAQKDAEKAQRNSAAAARQDAKDTEKAERDKLEGFARIAKQRAKLLELQAAKNREKARKDAADQAAKDLAAFEKQQEADINASAVTNPLAALNESISKIGREGNFQNALNLIENTFFSPLSSAFEQLLTDTDFTFKEFGKIITNAIKRFVAQVIATGIIQLITTILTGGFSSGISAGLNAVFKGTASALGFSTGLGAPARVANPAFSSVGGGPMNMSGSVNLTLRGSDLVASMNRTNTTINRVG